MILKGENRSTRRKTCPNATLSTKNLMDWFRNLASAVKGRRLSEPWYCLPYIKELVRI